MATKIFDCLLPGSTPADIHRVRCDSQSTSYYADLSRYICKFLLKHETLSLLDVGPRTGTGLALLRLMHHPQAFTRLKFDPVVGIDIDDNFDLIAREELPDIKSLIGDIFDIKEKSFDVVTCSHTIEHIDKAEEFIVQLSKIARKAVFIACPFEEDEANRAAGHVRSINSEFFVKLGFDDIEIYESNHWHNGLCCLAVKLIN